MDVEIRSLTTYEDFKACEGLQHEALGYADIDIVPYQMLQSFALAGGIVLGAFEGSSLVGAVIGYTGITTGGVPYHRSQRLTVLSEYRGRGVGEKLKRAQAELALRYGLRQMCWTFDPLRSVNAHLNMHKLGATSRQYLERAYMASTSPRDAGISIDRLWVEWDLIEHSKAKLADDQQMHVVLYNHTGQPSVPDLNSMAPFIVIQIPEDIDAIRERNIQHAIAWRTATRDTFNHYFAHGYTAIDFLRGQGFVLVRAQ